MGFFRVDFLECSCIASVSARKMNEKLDGGV